jgi:hypothetical protein
VFRILSKSIADPTLFINSAALGFHGMAKGGHWSAPGVLLALAGVVHDSQRAEDHEHKRDENNK